MLRIAADIHDEDSYNEFMIGVREESGTMATMVWCACGNVLRSKSVEELNLLTPMGPNLHPSHQRLYWSSICMVASVS
jgi:hypothetical protein